MPICPKCRRLCKTAQGLSGHMRFRHQMTVPKQDLTVYAKDRLEKAEDENAKLREQVARLQSRHQDQETFYEKKMVEQKTELERAQEHKLAEQQKLELARAQERKLAEQQKLELARAQERKLAEQQKAILKEHADKIESERRAQHEEQIRSERARAEEEAVAALQKQIQDLQKRIEANSQKKKTDEAPLMYTDASRASTVEQPLEPATPSRWKPSDFLPAAFPHPPLPRGLFKH